MRGIQKWENEEVERRRKRALAEELSERMCTKVYLTDSGLLKLG